MTSHRFPEGFVWGAATSAYQIEGSPLADGAGPSIQHRYAHTPGNTLRGENGDFAADHYRRFLEDVAIMRDMGLQAYQFSTAWPRVLPEGTGAVNQAGLDFYDRLVDALLEAGVAPAPILYVWDLPAVLQDRGGWANRDSADWFAEYTAVVFDLIGDRATHWFTICEPDAVSLAGYAQGGLAPATRDLYAGLRAAHHVLLAHGRAVEAFRASGASGVIGTSSGVTHIKPASDSEADIAAAERADAYSNGLFLDPVMLGKYPAEIVERFGDAWPEVRDGDLATISAPIDFLGLTYYSTMVVADGAEPPPAEAEAALKTAEGPALMGTIIELASHRDLMAETIDVRVLPPTGPFASGFGFKVDPDGLYQVLTGLRDRYGNPPLYITEVGSAYPDVVVNGEVDDPERLSYLRDHFIAAHRAIAEGVDLRGCFVWSLLDTWEFFLGFHSRFGLVHVDYETQRRIVKSSGHWYRDVMADNALP